jgi:hypothetical protein
MSIRLEEGGDQSIRFSVDKLEIPIFNLCCLIYEVDLYPKWFPFCKRGDKYEKIHMSKNLANTEFMVPFPFSNREGNFNGFGSLDEGTILLCVRSSDINFETKEWVPDFHGHANKKPRGNNVSLISYIYGFELTPLDSKSFSIRACTRMDPQMGVIPQGMINFFTKQFMKFLISKMIKIGNNFKGTPFDKRL